jgi:hypothetical protein
MINHIEVDIKEGYNFPVFFSSSSGCKLPICDGCDGWDMDISKIKLGKEIKFYSNNKVSGHMQEILEYEKW